MRLFLFLSCALALTSCSSVYYGAMEKIGIPKRQILVERVESARGAQQAAKQQFASALEHFLSVTKVPPTELKGVYDRLNDELKRSEARAKEVRDRIGSIDSVAQALFGEWNLELAQYSNPALRAQSERQLDATKRRYAELMRVMNVAADRMEPVLVTFRDQVLFLKHNLNAQAIAALSSTSQNLQQDIGRLIADMEKSIKEADAFISTMQAVK
ncbi:MAG: DUF2959 domain-containing protein [Candidatus Didemnitutus sp.]|nr:DUF2959 domain-containing protein [Candidatus Didemnitutus sp.]